MMMVLPATMKAIRVHAPHDYRLDDVPVPVVGPGEVLIEVEAAGICASDVKCWHGGGHFWPSEHGPGYVEAPAIVGHEFSGRVVAMGDGAAERHGVALGDRVVTEQIVPCEDCRFCRSGDYWMCERHWIFGFKQVLDGGMARFCRLPRESRIHPLPESLSLEAAAYVEPLACAWHAVERGRIAPGDTVAIIGIGNIGLCMLQVARSLVGSGGRLVAIGTRPYRLDLARQLGADEVIDVTREDAVARVQALTDGYGADVVIEASGNPDAVVQGLGMIRKLGTFVEFSVFSKAATVNWTVIGDTKELTIHGSHLGPNCYPKAIAALADGSVDVRPLVGNIYPLDRFDEAMREAATGDVMKNLVLPI
jgi:L-iditol 2-dehydrogenase